MWYGYQWVHSPSKSQFVKVNHYRSKYGLLHRALAHTEQQAMLSNKHVNENTSYHQSIKSTHEN